MAFFWEPTYKVTFIRVMRRIYKAIPCAPKRGSPHEHPLSQQEITILKDAFDGNLHMYPAPFTLFSDIVKWLNLIKFYPMAKIASETDQKIDTVLPFLRRWSYRQILVFSKQ
jgi:hypothetical protein